MKKIVKKIFLALGISVSKVRVSRYPAQEERQITPKHFFDLFFSSINPADFYFVQVGANDGKTNDLLHEYITKYNLSGTIVEPQPDVFEKLKASYQYQNNLHFSNVALASSSGQMSFYTVKKELRTDENFFQVTAISSFNRKVFEETVKKRVPHIIKYISNNIEDYTEIITVPALSFEDFVSRNKILKIDFLFLDCEGYDFEILKTINFEKIKPKVINFESKFLSDQDRSLCEALLERNGYKLFRYANDTCAFL